MREQDRATRNLNPHAEARVAMAIWSFEYAFKQSGGSMDFWDSLSPGQKMRCVDIVDKILASPRAALAGEDGK